MPVNPQTRANDLIDRLNQLSLTGASEDAFVFRQLKRDAEALLKVDALSGYMVLGAIAAFQNDIAALHENHRKAIRLGPNNADAHSNYGVSLSSVGLIVEGLIELKKGYELESSPVKFEGLVDHLFKACRFKEAATLIEEYNQAGNYPHGSLIQLAGKIATSRNVSDDELAKVQQTALNILVESKVHPRLISLRAPQRDLSSYVHVLIQVDQSISSVISLNVRLAEKLAEMDFRSEVVEMLSVSYTKGELSGGNNIPAIA